MVKNEVLFSKGKRNLKSALDMLKTQTGLDADPKVLEEVATLSLVAVRNLLQLAGRIDVPRPDPIPVKRKPKPKVVPPSIKTGSESARVGTRPKYSNSVFDVSGGDEGPSTRIKTKLSPKRKKKK